MILSSEPAFGIVPQINKNHLFGTEWYLGSYCTFLNLCRISRRHLDIYEAPPHQFEIISFIVYSNYTKFNISTYNTRDVYKNIHTRSECIVGP